MAAIYIECDLAATSTGLSPLEIAEMVGYDSPADWFNANPSAVESIAIAAERNGRGDYASFLRQCLIAATAATLT